MFQRKPSNDDQALLVVLKVLAHTGNDNFVAVITDICILAVRFLTSFPGHPLIFRQGIDDDDVW